MPWIPCKKWSPSLNQYKQAKTLLTSEAFKKLYTHIQVEYHASEAQRQAQTFLQHYSGKSLTHHYNHRSMTINYSLKLAEQVFIETNSFNIQTLTDEISRLERRNDKRNTLCFSAQSLLALATFGVTKILLRRSFFTSTIMGLGVIVLPTLMAIYNKCKGSDVNAEVIAQKVETEVHDLYPTVESQGPLETGEAPLEAGEAPSEPAHEQTSDSEGEDTFEIRRHHHADAKHSLRSVDLRPEETAIINLGRLIELYNTHYRSYVQLVSGISNKEKSR